MLNETVASSVRLRNPAGFMDTDPQPDGPERVRIDAPSAPLDERIASSRGVQFMDTDPVCPSCTQQAAPWTGPGNRPSMPPPAAGGGLGATMGTDTRTDVVYDPTPGLIGGEGPATGPRFQDAWSNESCTSNDIGTDYSCGLACPGDTEAGWVDPFEVWGWKACSYILDAGGGVIYCDGPAEYVMPEDEGPVWSGDRCCYDAFGNPELDDEGNVKIWPDCVNTHTGAGTRAAGATADRMNEPDGQALRGCSWKADAWRPNEAMSGVECPPPRKSRRGLPAPSYVTGMTADLGFADDPDAPPAVPFDDDQIELLRMAWALIYQNLDVLWWAFCRTLGDLPELGDPDDTGQTNAKDAWGWLWDWWQPFTTLRPMRSPDAFTLDAVSELPEPRQKSGRGCDLLKAGTSKAAADSIAAANLPETGAARHYPQGAVGLEKLKITVYTEHPDFIEALDAWRSGSTANQACAAVFVSAVLVHELAHAAGLRLNPETVRHERMQAAVGRRTEASTCAPPIVMQNLWMWALMKRYKAAGRSSCCSTWEKQEVRQDIGGGPKQTETIDSGVGFYVGVRFLYWNDDLYTPSDKCGRGPVAGSGIP